MWLVGAASCSARNFGGFYGYVSILPEYATSGCWDYSAKVDTTNEAASVWNKVDLLYNEEKERQRQEALRAQTQGENTKSRSHKRKKKKKKKKKKDRNSEST